MRESECRASFPGERHPGDVTGSFRALLSIKALWIYNVNLSLNFFPPTLWEIMSGTEMPDCMLVICAVNTLE